MNKLLTKLSLIFLLCPGCQSPPGHGRQAVQDSRHGEGAYRFLRVYQTPAGDTVYTDSTVLQFSVNDSAGVSGTYHWVLPGKDGKYGAISGRMSEDTVYGRYRYRQEGGDYDDSVLIILKEGNAVVTQFSPDNYLLKDTLAQK